MEQPPVVGMTPEALFRDAEELQKDAIRILENGDIRDAAEKAWGATVAATRGLMLARTGQRPDTTTGARMALNRAADRDPRLENLDTRFAVAMAYLHGACFYDGNCEPRESVEKRIRQTADFVAEARRMARR